MLLENKKSKEILIFYSGTNGIGGIETLLSRLMTFLQQSGYSATCIMRNATPIVSLLGGHRVLSLNENFSDLMDPGRLKRLLTQERLCSAAAVISLDSYSSIFAALTARILRSNKCIAVSTNWVPNYYSKTIIAGWRPLPLLLRWNMKSNFNSRTTLVMMEKYRQDGQRALGSNWNATIMPIPVPTHASTDFIHVPEPGKIVSIGRLDAMKSYNVYMIETMSKLRSMGFNINWHVYGTGVLQEEMDTLILERKASGYIKLHGDLPYSDITRILSSAHIFVGMGTSSIEAAVAGVRFGRGLGA